MQGFRPTLPEEKMPDAATAWIKPAIQTLLGTETSEQNVIVTVENVSYGTWLWDEGSHTHVHLPGNELRKTLGHSGVRKLRFSLVPVSTTWDKLRQVAGR